MLMIRRKIGEKVILWIGGERVDIVVTEINGGRAKLGFKAPQSVKILRGELEQTGGYDAADGQ